MERAQSLKAGWGLIFDTDQLYPFHFFNLSFLVCKMGTIILSQRFVGCFWGFFF